MALRCAHVRPAFAIFAATRFDFPLRRSARYASCRLGNTKPARPPLDETMVSSSGGKDQTVVKAVEWDDRRVTRFMAKVALDEHTGCWNWTGYRDKKGYGRFQYGTTDARLAYNVSYGWFVTDQIGDLQLDHTCENTSCVCPWHLDPVTAAVNMARRAGKKTHCPSGHAYVGSTIYRPPGGGIVCRICRKKTQVEAKRKARARRSPPEPRVPIAACKWGHEFTAENTYVVAGRERHCKACRARRERERQQRLRVRI